MGRFIDAVFPEGTPNYELRRKVVKVAASATLLAPVLGLLAGVAVERRTNSVDAQKAQKDRACIEVVQKYASSDTSDASVQLSALSDSDRHACRIPSPSSTADSFGGNANLSLHNGIKITNPSIDADVQLPSLATLETDAENHERGAKDFNLVQLPFVGAEFGGIALAADLVALCLFGMKNVLENEQRRRYE